jgi:hypothetical protein
MSMPPDSMRVAFYPLFQVERDIHVLAGVI